MRRKRLGVFGTVLCFAALISATGSAKAAPALPVGQVGEHLAAYVAAVNRPDLASATRFSARDLSPSLGQPPAAILHFFESQRRVTGGIESVGFRFEDQSQTRGVFVFKDAIYDGLRAVAFTFDDTPEVQRHVVERHALRRRLLDLGPETGGDRCTTRADGRLLQI